MKPVRADWIFNFNFSSFESGSGDVMHDVRFLRFASSKIEEEVREIRRRGVFKKDTKGLSRVSLS